jgi:uncharacterized RDD family membrane protein YckC
MPIMNTSKFPLLASVMALMLCAAGAAPYAKSDQSTATPGATDAPASAASAPAEDSDSTDWDIDHGTPDRRDRRGHHHRRSRHDNDMVNIGEDSDLASGQHADSVVSIFGSSSSEGESEDVVSVLGNTRVTGEVGDSAVAVLGNTFIDGKVGGDAVAVLGNVELGPHAEINGDVVAVGGRVQRDPAAIVHGDVHSVFNNRVGSGWLQAWVQECLLYGRPLSLAPGLGWAWGLALACLGLYVCLALLFRPGLTRCVQTLETQPGHTLLAALLMVLLTPVLMVLLCITVVGIAAVPFVVLGLFCAALFGKAVMLAWLGQRVAGKHAVGALSHPAFAVLVGGALVLLLYLVPVLGFFVYQLFCFLGIGAVAYTLILAAKAHQAAKVDGRSATAPAGPTPVAGSASMPGPAPMAGSASMADRASTAGAASMAGATPIDPTPAAGPTTAGESATTAASPAAPSPVTAALPRAGFWVRMGALLIDVLLVGFATSMLHHLLDLHVVLLAAYGAVMWKMRGSTIGGIVFDLRVVRLDGRPVDWETAIVRALSCFLSLAVAGLGFFWIAFDDGKRAWHDKIAGTAVVRLSKGVSLV